MEILANLGFYGYIRDDSDVLVDGAYYQAYFRQINGTSHASMWKTTVKQTTATGYYSFDLGDGDFLDVDGACAAGDQVIIAVWRGSDNDRTSDNKTAFSYYVYTLTADNIVLPQMDLWVYNNVAPTTLFSVVSSYPEQLTDFTLTNQCSDNATVGHSMYQTRYYNGIDVFPVCRVGAVNWTIDGASQATITGTDNQVLQLPYKGTPHVLTFTAMDAIAEQGNTFELNVNVTYRRPTFSLSWTPTNPTVEENIDFDLTVTNTDSNITTEIVDAIPVTVGTIKHFINRASSFGSDFTVNAGDLDTDSNDYTIRHQLVCDDGWSGASYETLTHNASLVMQDLLPVSNFTETHETVPGTRYIFTATGADPDGDIVNWLWEIISPSLDVIYTHTGTDVSITYTFTSAGTYNVRLTVTDNDGNTHTKTTPFAVTVSSTGGLNMSRYINIGGM